MTTVRDSILSRLPELLIAIGIIVMFVAVIVTRNDDVKGKGTCVIQTPRYTMACNGRYDCYRLDTQTGDVKEVQ